MGGVNNINGARQASNGASPVDGEKPTSHDKSDGAANKGNRTEAASSVATRGSISSRVASARSQDSNASSSQRQNNSHKSALLNDLDRRGQHIQSRLEKSSDRNSHSQSESAKSQSRAPAQNQTDKSRGRNDHQEQGRRTQEEASAGVGRNPRNRGADDAGRARGEGHAKRDQIETGSEASIDSQRAPSKQQHKDLPRGMQRALNTLNGGSVNDGNASIMGDARGAKAEKLIARLLEQTGQTSAMRGQSHTALGRAEGRQVVNEINSVRQLVKHFAQLEKKGGETVRRAEEIVWRLLGRERPPVENASRALFGEQPSRSSSPAPFRPSELLRDLRTSAFLPAQERNNPFPLTGRARVASEMMELMHTLDAIERHLNEPHANGSAMQSGAKFEADLETIARQLGISTGALPEELLSMLPMLPGRAARMELLRLMATLGGEPLTDMHGHGLLSKNGVPLKPDQLLLLNMAGGALAGQLNADSFSTRLSPLLMHGFDALYSLIGFDGRSLAAPHFASLQVQVNASELEWVFGQPPLTEGWARALIEKLKDASQADHNLLGEMLEEALLDGRFHTILLQGTVAEGEAVADSFNISRFLPGSAAEINAFAPA